MLRIETTVQGGVGDLNTGLWRAEAVAGVRWEGNIGSRAPGPSRAAYGIWVLFLAHCSINWEENKTVK